MLDNKNISFDFSILWFTQIEKIYTSNIGFIVIPKDWDYIFKLFTDINLYNNELSTYNLFFSENINIPNFYDLWKIGNYYILKLENIRKEKTRFEHMKDVDLQELSNLLLKIYTIKNSDTINWKVIILWDIHSSNFFKRTTNWILWVFDFSSTNIWFIEQDLACLYIEFELDNYKLNKFIGILNLKVDYNKIYYYSLIKLLEIVKNWMNIDIKRKKIYIKYINILKLKLSIN